MERWSEDDGSKEPKQEELRASLERRRRRDDSHDVLHRQLSGDINTKVVKQAVRVRQQQP